MSVARRRRSARTSRDHGLPTRGASAGRFPGIEAVGDPTRPGIVHRLDRDTSGLLVVARSAAAYEGTLREALHAFKFSGKRALARPLGDLAIEQCRAFLPHDIEALIPVPLAYERERERGYNQAARLAERLARPLGIPAIPGWLGRVRATRPQSDLAAAERQANVRGAFRAAGRVAGRHVLVVDDVLTTGATLGACARALRGAGARRIGVLTVARVLHAAV